MAQAIPRVICERSSEYRLTSVLHKFRHGRDELYDIRAVAAESNYPPDITDYMNRLWLNGDIGAVVPWGQLNYLIFANFLLTGDWIRDFSGYIEKVVDAGVRTVMFAGDAVSRMAKCYLL